MAYIHGTDPVEQDRLSKLNALLNEECLERVRPDYGSRILDVGSGLGQFTRLLARSCSGSALGIERSEEQLALARKLAEENEEETRVEFRKGEAENLPLGPDERGSFDLAHTRFVLEHVQEPLRVVHQMVEAVKPRGRIALLDDDHDLMRFYPDAPAVMRIWAAYIESYRGLGNEPLLGRRMPELLFKAGALPTRTDLINFGACKGEVTFDPLCDNWIGLINGARGTMLEHSLISQNELDAGLQEFAEWRQVPYANMVFAFVFAEGIRL